MADGASNPYIRTYAKDVAMLTGQGTAPATAKPIATKAKKDREDVLARLRQKVAAVPAKEPVLMPQAPLTPAPTVAPVATPPPAPRPAPMSAPMPTVAPKPTPVPPPKPAPVPSPVAVVPPTPIAAPAAPRPTAPAPRVLPPAVPLPGQPAPAAVPAPSPLHTFSSDFSQRIDAKSASAFSVLAAQADAAPPAPQVVRPRRGPSTGLMVTFASIILIVLGASGLYAAYRYVSTPRTVPITTTAPSLIFADDEQALSGEGNDLVNAIASSADAGLGQGQVRVLYLSESSTTPEGKKVTIPLGGGQLIGALQLSAPDILLRNIAPESTVGIVHAGKETRAFFIIRVESYERTFSGMLQWEPTMQASLAKLYPLYVATFTPEPKVITTTKFVNGKVVVSTTTEAAPTATVNPPQFVDEVASNHDVRALKDDQGRTILLYGYVDKTTLVIARDEAAFAELVRRLSATKQQ